jgi:hypothetical protein
MGSKFYLCVRHMSNLKKFSIILVANLLLFGLADLIFGILVPGPPEYLNTKNQYTSNYRNYFTEFTDINGNKFWGVDNSVAVDVNYQHTSFEPNSIKVLAIGDSFTAGQGVKQQDTWVKQLEKKIIEHQKVIRNQLWLRWD